MIDSHCHVAGPEFAGDLDAVLARARDAGLAHALVILAADDTTELQQASAVWEGWDRVRFSIGVHPHAAGQFAGRPHDAAAVVERAIDRQPLTRAVGEMGLDYHYDLAPREAQQEVFRAQIGLARARRLPIVIHTREATTDTFSVLREERAADVGGVFHCFTGDRQMAREALDAGFYISFAGIVTFPKADELRAVAAMVPLERLLIETDSPFLSPVPLRGTRNEPANVRRIAETVARARGADPQEVGAAAVDNFVRLFNP